MVGDGLGRDQAEAVATLCGRGPALRALISPAGYGKTTTLASAAPAANSAGRDVLGLATTNQAVVELRRVGIPSFTIAFLGAEDRTLRPGSVVILDEVSQVATADAELVASAVAATPGASLWCAGDAAQAQSVRAGGLAVEVERLSREGAIPSPALTHNRRQIDETERAALSAYRAGGPVRLPRRRRRYQPAAPGRSRARARTRVARCHQGGHGRRRGGRRAHPGSRRRDCSVRHPHRCRGAGRSHPGPAGRGRPDRGTGHVGSRLDHVPFLRPGRPGPTPRPLLVLGSPDRDEVDDAAERAENEIGLPVQVTVRSFEQWRDGDDAIFHDLKRRPLVPVLIDDEQVDIVRELDASLRWNRQR